MPHLDSEQLVLLALGEQVPTDVQAGHLDACPICRSELDTLAAVVGVGRETRQTHDLPAPPARVWDAIVAGIGHPDGASAPTTVPAPPHAPRPVVTSSGSRAARRRWARTAVIGVAAAVIGVVGTVGAFHVTARLNAPVVTAQADLTAYGSTPPTAHGSARVLDEHGQAQLHLHVTNLPASPGYYEVWLIDPDTTQMFSIGVLGGQSDVLLPLPSSVDLKGYRLVDVSAEPYDGDAAHSGHSLLRGTLHG